MVIGTLWPGETVTLLMLKVKAAVLLLPTVIYKLAQLDEFPVMHKDAVVEP